MDDHSALLSLLRGVLCNQDAAIIRGRELCNQLIREARVRPTEEQTERRLRHDAQLLGFRKSCPVCLAEWIDFQSQDTHLFTSTQLIAHTCLLIEDHRAELLQVCNFARDAFPSDMACTNGLLRHTNFRDHIGVANRCRISYQSIGSFKMTYEAMMSAASKPVATVFSSAGTIDTVVTPKQAIKLLRTMLRFDKKDLSECSALLTHTTLVGNHILMVRLRRALLF